MSFKFRRIVDLSDLLDPGKTWLREDLKKGTYGPCEEAFETSGRWGTRGDAHKEGMAGWIRPWIESLSIKRSLEPYPFLQLLEEITIWAHSGTHVDSPLQNDPHGKCLTDLDLDKFCGEAVALDLAFVGPSKEGHFPPFEGGEINAKAMQKFEGKIKKGDFVFVSTGFTGQKAPMLDKGAAEWLLKQGIKGYGMDNSVILSGWAHTLFHDKEITTIDRVNAEGLRSILGQRFFTVCFPLRIKDLSASPCRVVAFLE